jgi:hypothetical protein
MADPATTARRLRSLGLLAPALLALILAFAQPAAADQPQDTQALLGQFIGHPIAVHVNGTGLPVSPPAPPVKIGALSDQFVVDEQACLGGPNGMFCVVVQLTTPCLNYLFSGADLAVDTWGGVFVEGGWDGSAGACAGYSNRCC